MNLIKRLVSWFDNRHFDYRLERYLASSVDLSDLERRQVRWESMSEAERNRWWNV